MATDLPLTVADLIAATKDHLQGTYRSEWNSLLNAIGPTDTTISLTGPIGGAARTAYLAIEDEIVYVQSSVPSPAQATVIRGFDGTVAVSHAANTLVEVSPRFPNHSIRRQLALEIASWPDNIFQVAQTPINLVNDGKTFAYDFGIPSAQVLYLLDVRHAPWSTTNRNTWPAFSLPPKINRGVDINTFPSGIALEIPCVNTAGSYELVGSVEAVVTYATGFNLSDMSDTVPTGNSGFTATLTLPAYGVGATPSSFLIAQATPYPMGVGTTIIATTFGGGGTQNFALSADVPAGSRTLPVVPQTLTINLPVGSTFTASLPAGASNGIGLANSMLDIPPLGAAYRLIGPREALRTFGEAMDQQRSTQDVPAGAAMRIASWLKQIRDQRIAEEIEHLNVAWPMRMK